MQNKKFQDIVDKAYKAGGIVGMSITTTEKGKHTHFTAGHADVAAGQAVTERTVFPWASCTKSFFAVAAAILHQKGELSLDTPIKKYIPTLSLVDKYTENNVTIRDLLCHRSGIPRHDVAWAMHIEQGLTPEGIVAKLAHLPPFASFREKFSYNNMCYVLAGEAARAATGKVWSQAVREEITDKAGIKDISFDVAGMDTHADRALRYINKDGGGIEPAPYTIYDANGPATTINTSTSELIKWIDAQMNGTLDADALALCHSPQMGMPPAPAGVGHPDSDMACFGLGFGIHRFKGKKLLAHTGGIDGFISVHFLMPDLGFGGAIAASVTGTPAYLMHALMFALADLALGNEPDWEQICKWLTPPAVEPPVQEIVHTITALPLEEYVGHYAHPGYGEMEVVLRDGKLAILFGTFDIPLSHFNGNFFNLFEGGNGLLFPAQFITNRGGKVTAFDIQLEALLEQPARFDKK